MFGHHVDGGKGQTSPLMISEICCIYAKLQHAGEHLHKKSRVTRKLKCIILSKRSIVIWSSTNKN